jgi:hypothetical protein
MSVTHSRSPFVSSCRVTIRAARASETRRQPKEGDRLFIKSRGGWHVRKQARHQGHRLVRNGRPVWEWVREDSL